MRLKLTVAGKEIASVPLDASRINSHVYLQSKQRLLAMANLHWFHQLEEPPVYYIEVASKMNPKETQTKRKARRASC
ncbi:MAG TPA: hypothetical protein VFL47_06415 [Flavisolibacter sp.]|nr:hypothetical protein [Flavisolibacter sp.]